MASVENRPIESRPSIRQAIYRATERLRGMALRLGVDVLLIVAGFGLATMVIDARATHDASGDVHACINLYTAQSRILIPGQAPTCTANEFLVEWPGPALATDVSDLEARLDELTDTVEALETANATQQAQIDDLEIETSDQQTLIDTLTGDLTALGEQVPDCLSEDANADAVFEGCNVRVLSGSGATNGAVNGKGNLIVGYNENDAGAPRSGSHNLVVGRNNGYSSFGGLVVGRANTISGAYASVSGGLENTASGPNSSVSGGRENTASLSAASVSGGFNNEASGNWSSVSGGQLNEASGNWSSVSGGNGNTARGDYSSVSGGGSNRASAAASSVGGGEGNTAEGVSSSVSGGQLNLASGLHSSVSGGGLNTASNTNSSVSGGTSNTASGISSSVSGGASVTAPGGSNWAAGGLFQLN